MGVPSDAAAARSAGVLSPASVVGDRDRTDASRAAAAGRRRLGRCAGSGAVRRRGRRPTGRAAARRASTPAGPTGSRCARRCRRWPRGCTTAVRSLPQRGPPPGMAPRPRPVRCSRILGGVGPVAGGARRVRPVHGAHRRDRPLDPADAGRIRARVRAGAASGADRRRRGGRRHSAGQGGGRAAGAGAAARPPSSPAIETASVAIVTLAYSGVRLPPGSGLLVGAREGLAVKASRSRRRSGPGCRPAWSCSGPRSGGPARRVTCSVPTRS